VIIDHKYCVNIKNNVFLATRLRHSPARGNPCNIKKYGECLLYLSGVKKAVRGPLRVFSLKKVHSGRFCGVFPGIEPKKI